MFKSSRLFLYLGFGLFFLALVTFPTRVMIQVQPGDFDDVSVGWLFAPIIGAWGLAGVALGITESSLTKKDALLSLLPVFALIYIGLGLASWVVTVYGANWFWRVYFGLLLFPCLIANTACILYFKEGETRPYFDESENKKAHFHRSNCRAAVTYSNLFALVYHFLLKLTVYISNSDYVSSENTHT